MTRSLWHKGWTPIKILPLQKYLLAYENVEDAQLLLEGFTEGFRLQYTGPRKAVNAQNLVSALIHNTETLEKLQKEVQLGRMLGPFVNNPISTLRISPIGLVEKSDGGWRLITHLSFPEGNSVNDFIHENFCKVKYSSFDKVLEMISELGRGAKLGKIDIRQAFRLLIVNPSDFDLLGIKFNGKFYVDKCLPMGCAISCSLFEKFSTFLHWAVKSKSGFDTLDHYLDDFIFAGEEATNTCEILMDSFKELCLEIGVPIADNKTVGPTTSITFLGLVIDTERMLVRIPLEKIYKLKLGIQYIQSSKKIKVKDLESIVGLMAFCARAIPSARAFSRRFYDVISSVNFRKPYFFVRINQEIKEDARVWGEFLGEFNGECYLPNRLWLSNDVIELFTDSAGNALLGCGAYFNGHWAQFKWPVEWGSKEFMSDISFLELIPILMAMFIWTSEFISRKILLRIDNQALVAIINKRTSKSKFVMKLIRPLVLLLMRKNIQIRALHVQGIFNEIADSLSRFQMDRFRRLAPSADKTPSDIPVEFLSIVSDLK